MQQKIEKLRKYYDLNIPEDLFTLLPQEMEVVEVRAMAQNFGASIKKDTVVNIVMGISKAENLDLDVKNIEFFVDAIASASKGKIATMDHLNLDEDTANVLSKTLEEAANGTYALNKVKK